MLLSILLVCSIPAVAGKLFREVHTCQTDEECQTRFTKFDARMRCCTTIVCNDRFDYYVVSSGCTAHGLKDCQKISEYPNTGRFAARLTMELWKKSETELREDCGRTRNKISNQVQAGFQTVTKAPKPLGNNPAEADLFRSNNTFPTPVKPSEGGGRLSPFKPDIATRPPRVVTRRSTTTTERTTRATTRDYWQRTTIVPRWRPETTTRRTRRPTTTRRTRRTRRPSVRTTTSRPTYRSRTPSWSRTTRRQTRRTQRPRWTPRTRRTRKPTRRTTRKNKSGKNKTKKPVRDNVGLQCKLNNPCGARGLECCISVRCNHGRIVGKKKCSRTCHSDGMRTSRFPTSNRNPLILSPEYWRKSRSKYTQSYGNAPSSRCGSGNSETDFIRYLMSGPR